MGEPDVEGLFERPERFPGLPPLCARDRLLRVWVCPSFTLWTSWSVYRSGAARQVRRVMLVPRALADGAAPWGADGFAPASEVEGLVAALEGIELAPFASVATLGVDGTTYGVERGDHCCRRAWRGGSARPLPGRDSPGRRRGAAGGAVARTCSRVSRPTYPRTPGPEAIPMNPNLSPEAQAACIEVLGRGMIEIRASLWSGDPKRAEAIADALHNLPQLVLEGERFNWSLREFRGLFLADLVGRYPDLAGMDRILEPYSND